jgi:hypothetical protein
MAASHDPMEQYLQLQQAQEKIRQRLAAAREPEERRRLQQDLDSNATDLFNFEAGLVTVDASQLFAPAAVARSHGYPNSAAAAAAVTSPTACSSPPAAHSGVTTIDRKQLTLFRDQELGTGGSGTVIR